VLLFRKRNVANSKCRSLISSYRPLVLFTLSLFAHWLFARWPALRTSLHQPRSLTSLTHSSDLEPLVLFDLLRSSALGFVVTISIPEMHKLLRQAIATARGDTYPTPHDRLFPSRKHLAKSRTSRHPHNWFTKLRTSEQDALREFWWSVQLTGGTRYFGRWG
jgi:hypothetical protein